MFFKTGVIRKLAIFTGKLLNLESLFNKLYFNLVPKETSMQVIPVKIAKFLQTPFLWNTSGGYFCHLDEVTCSVMGICLLFLIKNKMYGMVFTINVLDLVRVCYLHVINKNNSNTFLLINLQKTKTCPK